MDTQHYNYQYYGCQLLGGGLSIRSYLVFGKNLTPGAGSLTQNMHEISCAVRGSELDDPACVRTLGTEKTYEITMEMRL